MWTRWRRSSSQLAATARLHNALLLFADGHENHCVAHAHIQRHGVSTRSTNILFTNTALLLRRNDRRDTEFPPLPLSDQSTADTASTAAVSPPKSSKQKEGNDRTAELLRRIARRGGGLVRRAQPEMPATLFRKDTPHGKKYGAIYRREAERAQDAAISPLERLFEASAAPPRAALRPTRQTSSPPTAGSASSTSFSAVQVHNVNRTAAAAVAALSDTPVTTADIHNVQVKSNRSSPPSRTLLTKLLRTIQQEKRVPWAAVVRAHPEVLHMPLYASRDNWHAQMCAHCSAAPLSEFHTSSADASFTPPLFLCAASTGTGKSVLLPLFALDAHWATLEQRLQRTLDQYDTLAQHQERREAQPHTKDSSIKKEEASNTPLTQQLFPLSSQADFIRAFTACSRLCIVVSQPTRLACAELAKYVSALLDVASHTPTPASEMHTSLHTSNRNKRKEREASQSNGVDAHRQLIGKRIGYAVGGEQRFCAETELLYATPGFLLNALQLTSLRSTSLLSSAATLSPTTLMVDEAHCRDIETDALLAWLKLSRNASTTRHHLRQYYVMSATMRLTAMDAYLSRPLPNKVQKGWKEGIGRQQKWHREMVNNSEGCEGDEEVSPILLLSPAQRQHVQRWWQGRQKKQRSSTQIISASAPHLHADHKQRGDVHSAEDWSAQIQHDRRIRRAVLQLLETTEGEIYNEGDGVAPATDDPIATPYEPFSSRSSDSSFNRSAAASSNTRASAGSRSPHLASTVGDMEVVNNYSQHLPQGIVVSTAPYRVERFFIDDLDPKHGCFARSRVLFDAETRRAVAATGSKGNPSSEETSSMGNTSTNSRGTVVSSSLPPHFSPNAIRNLPLCLADEGRALRQLLIQTFNTRPASYNFFSGQSRLLASFVVQIMQAARHRWVSPSSASIDGVTAASATHAYFNPSTTARRIEEDATAPVTILLFMSGIADIYQLIQSLERVCEKVQQRNQNNSTLHTSTTPMEVLRSGNEVFSIGVLHASAVGNPQEQLTATEQAGAPLRLLLTTNVAESSLTIPNTRVVIDTCLERRVQADELTGTVRLQTAFVSPSGLRQRCGRVGRTADGVAIHMAPRHYVLPQLDRRVVSPERRVYAPVQAWEEDIPNAGDLNLEPLVDGVVTVLLRMKYLFEDVAAALDALPSPPTRAGVRVALQQLVDMELLVLPETTSEQQKADSETTKLLEDASHTAGAPALLENKETTTELECEEDVDTSTVAPALNDLLNKSTFTAKGLLVSSLPLPFEHATLVYHAFQFLCVEDAVLMACAMAVPTLFTVPRITAHSVIRTVERKNTDSDFTWSYAVADAKPALSPLENFYKRLCVQRDLAGFSCPRVSVEDNKQHEENSNRSGQQDTSNAGIETDRVGHLSEPLLLHAVLRRWYALSSVAGAGVLLNHFSINRAALRQVDGMVEQCCSRLICLLLRQRTNTAHYTRNGIARDAVNEQTEEGEEVDFGAYVCAASSSGSPRDVTLPFVDTWPDGMRDQLLRSLRRLQRAAHSRVHLRHTRHHYQAGLPQWYDSEERCIRLCSQPYLWNRKQSRRSQHTTQRTPPPPAARQQRTIENGNAGDTLDDEQQEQQQHAVRRHPSFAYWGRPQRHQFGKDTWKISSTAVTSSSYPSPIHSEVRLMGKTNISTTTAATVPPPIQARLTRARSPVYRPPPPPPPIPPVAFLLGRTEDRLCAAFVAAFGHRTMRGEDGGHRFHHQRLVRNLQTLQQDADHVCTFQIEVQPASQLALPNTNQSMEGKPLRISAISYERLKAAGVTPQIIRAALEPYFVGAGLQQLEVFQSNRLALAARFASSRFDGLRLPSIEPMKTSSAVSEEDKKEEEDDGGNEGSVEVGDMTRLDHTLSTITTGTTQNDDKKILISKPKVLVDVTESSSGRPFHEASGAAYLLKPIPLSSLRTAPTPSTQQQQRKEEPESPRHSSPKSRQNGTAGNPFVQLAPFGVSLLVAALSGSSSGSGVGGLQRIPLPTIAPSPSLQISSSLRTTDTQTFAATISPVVSANSNTSSSDQASTRYPAAADVRRALRFSSESPNSMSVSWTDVFGTYSRSVSRDACVALELADLFPSPAPTLASTSSSSGSTGGTHSEKNKTDEAQTESRSLSSSSAPVVGASLTSAYTLSVLPPVYITRSITWKVPLPVAISFPEPDVTRTARRKGGKDTATGSHAARCRTPPHMSLPYCVLCQHLCGSRRSFEQHCRSAVHLNRLYHAVQLGLTRTQLEQFYGSFSPPRARHQQQHSQKELAGEDADGSVRATHHRGKESRNSKRASRSSPSLLSSASSTSISSTAAMPLISLLSLENTSRSSRHHARSTRAPLRLLTQQLHPCVVHSLSFLNCLQWIPRKSANAAVAHHSTPAVEEEGEADRATPLAVAGSLVSMQTTFDILPPPHQRTHLSSASLDASPTFSASTVESEEHNRMGGRDDYHSSVDAALPLPSTVSMSTLVAQHVWVLDVSSRRGSPQSPSPPPMSLLFIIAGYLAAASPQAMVSLLVNAAHTYLHGVMLYGLGVWKLPEPLAMQEYIGVLEHIGRGGGWPGLLVPICGRQQQLSHKQQQPQRLCEGLHWCAPTCVCRMRASTTEPNTNSSSTLQPDTADRADDLTKYWPTIEATLLLTLHEYVQARRNMTTLADYVERVLRKLQLSPFLLSSSLPTASSSSSSSSIRISAAHLLTHYIAHARGGQPIQALLRDVGCVFMTPPHALSALLSADDIHDNFVTEAGDGDDDRGDWTSNGHPSRNVRQPKEEKTKKRRSSSSSGDDNSSSMSVAWSKRLSQRALGAEGAAVELMFTSPPVLPSVLPPADFAERLRNFYEERHAEREGVKTTLETVTHGKIQANASSRLKSSEEWDDRLLF